MVASLFTCKVHVLLFDIIRICHFLIPKLCWSDIIGTNPEKKVSGIGLTSTISGHASSHCRRHLCHSIIPKYCWSTPDWYRHTEASLILIKALLCRRKADGCMVLLGWAGGFPEMGSHERWTLTYQPSPQPKGPKKSWSRPRLNQGNRWTHLHSATPQSSRTLIPIKWIKWPTMKKFIASNQKRYIIKTKLKSKVRCKDIEFHPLFLGANRMKMSSEDDCNWQDGGFQFKANAWICNNGFLRRLKNTKQGKAASQSLIHLLYS